MFVFLEFFCEEILENILIVHWSPARWIESQQWELMLAKTPSISINLNVRFDRTDSCLEIKTVLGKHFSAAWFSPLETTVSNLLPITFKLLWGT